VVLRGEPTPLDPFEARRLLLTLLLLNRFAESSTVNVDASAPPPVTKVTVGRSGSGKRRHVRPPRSC